MAAREEGLGELLDNFVCLRITYANDLDLTQFQFDYDLTFAVLFLNADGTVYGRYGSRSQSDEPDSDVDLAGLKKTLSAALELHRKHPANRSLLSGKQPKPVKHQEPGDYPSLAGKYPARPDYEGQAARSCLHCHQIRDAERLMLRENRQPITDQVLYPFPSPAAVGMLFDPKERAALSSVVAESAAARAGLKPGDHLTQFNQQIIISPADISWVLHHIETSGEVEIEFQRDGAVSRTKLLLEPEWRRRADISWRVSTWDLRRMALGGMVLKPHVTDGRSSSPKLIVDHVGEYGEHAVAMKAGVRKGDILTALDGETPPATEAEVIGRILPNYAPGQPVPISLTREGRAFKVTYKAQ